VLAIGYDGDGWIAARQTTIEATRAQRYQLVKDELRRQARNAGLVGE
jgi:hypothetical protein